MLENKILISLLVGLPLYVSGASLVVLVILFSYWQFYKKEIFAGKKIFYCLGGLLAAFRLLYAFLLSYLQYTAWKANFGGIGKYLLPPYQPWAYFLRYVWIHFLLNAVLVIGLAAFFYLILVGIKKYRAEIFEDGEVELGTIGVLVVGWPVSILYVVLTFAALVIFSLINRLVFKKMFTTITWPLLVSMIIVFLWGAKLIEILNLTALKI